MKHNKRSMTITEPHQHLRAFALSALCILGACSPFDQPESLSGSEDAGGVDTSDTFKDTNDAKVPDPYIGVSISDPPDYHCANDGGNHGADLDAVELIDGILGTSYAFATEAVGFWGDGTSHCGIATNTAEQVLSNVYGPPDGGLAGGYIPLGGGSINVGFGHEITPAFEIQLHEVGADECGNFGCKDDLMIVGLVRRLDCEFEDSCYVNLSEAAVGDALIPLLGN